MYVRFYVSVVPQYLNAYIVSAIYNYPWQVGVALYLQEHDDLSDCCFTGASAGSFVASLLATDISIKQYMNTWVKDGYKIFNANPFGLYFICHSVISLVGSKYMSPDDYKRANNRLYVSISKFKNYRLQNELISEFTSNTDMYEALCASSQIPYLNSPSFYYRFRNHKCLDGGFTWNWIKLHESTLVISPYRWNRFKNKVYAVNALIANTEESFFVHILQGYLDAKKNDKDFLKHGLKHKMNSRL